MVYVTISPIIHIKTVLTTSTTVLATDETYYVTFIPQTLKTAILKTPIIIATAKGALSENC